MQNSEVCIYACAFKYLEDWRKINIQDSSNELNDNISEQLYKVKKKKKKKGVCENSRVIPMTCIHTELFLLDATYF